VEDPSAYGIARVDEGDRILEFKEKPRPEEAFSNLINAGTYLLEPEVLDLIPSGRSVSIEREVFPRLVDGRLYGYQAGEFWIDAGRPLDYIEAHRLLMNQDRGRYSRKLKAPGARVEPPNLIPKGTVVGRDARIGPNTSLGEGVVLGDGAVVVNSVLLDRVRVGARARVDHSVVGAGAFIGDGASVSRGTVVADGAEVAAGRRTANFEAVEGPRR
jgi:mannose-1-phosphate guanylyltransferase